MKRLGASVVAAATLFAAAPAAADPAGPTDYESEITAIEPAVDTVAASMLGGDSFLLLEVEPGTEVTVLGYRAEPYLRFLSDGTVEQNTNSPSYYLNEDRFGEEEIPEFATPDAEPAWEIVDADGTWAWHDHRTHWMNRQDPPGRAPGDQILEAVVPLIVDGTEVDLTVISTWRDDPSMVPTIVGAIFGALLVVLAALAVRSVTRAALLTSVLAVLALVVGLGQNWSLPPETGPSRLNWLLPLTGLALMGVAAAARRLDSMVRWALVAGGAAELALWAWLRRDVFGAAILPTDLPYWLDRLVTAAALAAGLGSTALAVYLVIRPPAPAPKA